MRVSHGGHIKGGVLCVGINFHVTVAPMEASKALSHQVTYSVG